MNCSRRDFARKGLIATATCGGMLGRLYGESTYTVQRGDTLGHVALKHGVTTTDLKRANRLDDDLIRIGQKLKIPPQSKTPGADVVGPASLYTVVRGDTLASIALAHGVSVADLRRSNGLTGDLIRVGEKLQVPPRVPSADLLDAVRARTAGIDVRTDNWKRIVVHHSGIKYGNAAKYDAAHRRRGMQNGLAYHFLIGNGIDSGDGEIEIGPRWDKQLLGGHVKSYHINLTAIGICLVGNFQKTHPSARQLEAFTQLMDWLRGEIIPKAKHFAGHRELRTEHTICPGKNFPLAAMHARYGD